MKKLFNHWKLYVLAFLLVLSVALILRLISLTVLPVFADEAIYIRWSQVMAHEPTLRFLPLSDGKQPLFMWILMFAVTRFNDPLFAGRLVSAFSGIGTMLGAGVLSYILFKSKKASVVAMLIWAISPFTLFFDRMALVDALLAFFAVWTAIFCVITARTRRLDTAMIGGFFLGGGLLTKSPALFFVILIPASFLFINYKSSRRAFAWLHLAGLFLVSLVIGYGMYNILRLGPNFQLIASRNLDYVYPITHIFQKPFDPFIPYLERAASWVWILGPATIYLLAGVSLLFSLKRFPKQLFFLFAWIFIPIAVNAEFAKVFTARYIFYTIPFFVILASSGFAKIKIDKIILIILIGFVIQSLYQNYFLLTNPVKAYLPEEERSGYLEEWSAGTGIKQITDYLNLQHTQNPDTQIVVGTEGYFGTLPDGLQMYMQNTPNVVVIGIGLSIKQLPDPLVEAKKSGDATYLVINKSRLVGEPKDLGLKLIAQYPKELRTPGTHEFVQFGPQEILYFFQVTN